MPILPRDQWPVYLLDYQELKGIFVGGCVARGDGSRFRAKAHAHHPTSPEEGWICVLSAKRLVVKELMLHELAHILVPGGHHDKWRAKLEEIGGTLDPVGDILGSYHKRKRPKKVFP